MGIKHLRIQIMVVIDIVPLAKYFVQRYNEEFHKKVQKFQKAWRISSGIIIGLVMYGS